MYNLSSLPEKIPLFPLNDVLLLPHSRLPLNIFEPRYLTMLDDVMKTDHRLIGMIQPLPDQERVGDPAVHAVGCAGRLTSFTETSDRRYMISLTGICRFHVQEVNNGFLPYATSDIAWDNFSLDLQPVQPEPAFDRERFLAVLERYLQVMELSTDWRNLKDAEDAMLINTMSMMCPFTPEEKQALLETQTVMRRSETLITLMEFALRENSAPQGRLQ
jgi:Lon protease-like protein